MVHSFTRSANTYWLPALMSKVPGKVLDLGRQTEISVELAELHSDGVERDNTWMLWDVPSGKF